MRNLVTRSFFILSIAFALVSGPKLGFTLDLADGVEGAADIADFYAWHTEAGTLITVLAFGPPIDPNQENSLDFLDNEVLYTIHIDNSANPDEASQYADNDNDNQSDIQIHVRLGQNSSGEWGYQIENLPGASTALVAPLGQTITAGESQAVCGVYDHPSFFDLEGYRSTLTNLNDSSSGDDIAFASLVAGAPVDYFAGLNTMAIVLEVPLSQIQGESEHNFLQVWPTTARP